MKKIFYLSVLTLGLLSACTKDKDPVKEPKPIEKPQPDKDKEEPTDKDEEQPQEDKPQEETRKIKSALVTKWDLSGSKQRFIEQSKEVFDEQGHLIEAIKYHNDGTVRERMVYKFDEQGLNTESFLYQKEQLRYHYKMTYNEQGKLVKKEWFTPDNKLELTNTLTYKADGTVIDELASANYVEETKQYTYNGKGLLIKMTYLWKDEPQADYYTNGIEIYDYNDKGLMTLKAMYKGDDVSDASKIETKEVWLYDEESILKAYELYGPNEKVRVKIVYASEVDKEGNWIKLIGKADHWANNSPTLIERELEYFD